MSADRFAGLRAGQIDLRDAYLTSEDGFVYEVTGEFLDLGEAEVSISDKGDRYSRYLEMH